MVPGGASGSDARKRSREYSLRKYILLLATVVATVTYTAGFSPPGGVWEETDLTAGNLAGDPIIRRTSYARYVAFFYLNVAAFASSLVVAVLILIVMKCDYLGPLTYVLRGFMVLDLLSILGAYTAGTYREGEMSAVYTMILAVLTIAYVVGIMVAACVFVVMKNNNNSNVVDDSERVRKRSDKDGKLLMLLTTFIVSLTYLSGLSVPGGFRQHGDEGGHRPGDPALLGGRHQTRLQAFACFNSTAFFCSLLITVQLLDKNRRLLHASVAVAIVGLVGAYAAGSSRDRATTIYVVVLAVGLTAYISLLRKIRGGDEEGDKEEDMPTATTTASGEEEVDDNKSRSSLVVLFATLAATITYQAGLHPPGGLWEKDGDGYVAGDPILRTTNPRRYDAFFYCNSAAFVASLVVIILVRKRTIVNYTTLYALRAALILDVFGLIGAYAAGSCRDVATSIYTMALAGAVPVYMVIHVAFIVRDHEQSAGGGKEDVVVEKRRKRLLLFAVLAANITYQAGLTPPGGFWPLGHRAGKPVLLSNFPRRYTAFYCNSVSFMLSIALVIILVNPKLYRPAIKSHSLSVCGVAGMFSLVGAFAAGSTQHLRTSIKIFGLVAVILIVILLVVRFAYQQPKVCFFDGKQKDMIHSRRKKLMLLGILAASVTYQAGLEPPGGVWQDDDGGQLGRIAGNPIMRDNRRTRYQAFFYINSTSFVASIVVIMLLLLRPKGGQKWWSLVAIMDTTIVVDLLALLLAYAVGSTRSGKDTGYVIVLVFSVLAYIAIYAVIYSGIHVWLVSWLRAIHIWLVSRLPEKVDPPTDSHRPNHEISEGDGT